MMRSLAMVALLLAAAGGVLPATAGEKQSKDKNEQKEPQEQPTRPPTPRDAVSEALLALANGNEAKALNAIRTTSAEQQELLKAILAFNQAALRFRAAFIKAYGPRAWENFQDPSQGPKDGNATLNLITEEAVKAKLDKLAIDEKGAEAQAHFPGEKQPTRLVKVEGGWALDFEGNFVPQGTLAGAKLAPVTQSLRGMARQVERYQKAIGAKIDGKEIVPDDIDAELGRALLQELTGRTTDTPHRFDVERLK